VDQGSGRQIPVAYAHPVAGGRSYTKIEEKAKILGESFHPTPPETDTTDIESYEYPLPIRAEPITETETARVIHRVGADKAPGPDGIINRILQLASQTITPILCKIFNACLATGYCPKHFRDQRQLRSVSQARTTTLCQRPTARSPYSIP